MSKNLLDNGTVLTLGLVGAVAAIGVATKRGVYGSRSTGPTDAEFRAVGRLTKAWMEDKVHAARDAGHSTDDLSIGKYIHDLYDEQRWQELLEEVREKGMVRGSKRFRVGDNVQYTKDFLRDSPWFKPPRYGKVVRVVGVYGGEQLVDVWWVDGTQTQPISNNLKRAGKV